MEPMPPASAPSQPAVLTSVMARTTRTAKAAAASWSRLGQIRHEKNTSRWVCYPEAHRPGHRLVEN
jgi:hypothetical protein